MGRYYFDTSALVKNYHAEAGTADVRRMLGEAGSESFIARLATVDMLSGFAGKVRTGVFSSGHYGKLRLRFLADVRRRVVRPIRVVNLHYQMAGDLIDENKGVRREQRGQEPIRGSAPDCFAQSPLRTA